jgi:hypothetical protein
MAYFQVLATVLISWQIAAVCIELRAIRRALEKNRETVEKRRDELRSLYTRDGDSR